MFSGSREWVHWEWVNTADEKPNANPEPVKQVNRMHKIC